MDKATTFSQLAQQVIGNAQVRPRTRETYRGLMRHAHRVGAIPAAEVTRADVQAVLADARAAGLSPSSVCTLLKVLRRILREAGNDAANAVRVSAPESAARALTEEEAARLTRTLQEVGTPDAQALLVLLGTGLRVGELRGLRSSDWDAGRRQLRVRAATSKSGRGRVVDVPDWLVPVLNGCTGSTLFPLQERRLRRVLAAAVAASGVPHCRLHDLRHTRITHLLLASVPVLYVSQQAGHSSPAFTLRVYGHVSAASHEERRAWANL